MREKGEGEKDVGGGEQKFRSELGTGQKRGGDRQAYLRNFQRVTPKPLGIGWSNRPVMGFICFGDVIEGRGQ